MQFSAQLTCNCALQRGAERKRERERERERGRERGVKLSKSKLSVINYICTTALFKQIIRALSVKRL